MARTFDDSPNGRYYAQIAEFARALAPHLTDRDLELVIDETVKAYAKSTLRGLRFETAVSMGMVGYGYTREYAVSVVSALASMTGDPLMLRHREATDAEL